MDKAKTMVQLFEKLDDLKSLFEFGQRIVPVIQNLIDFMKDIVPLLENINQSILDSSSKIPNASHQLSNVTSATEMATTEILDLVDEISNKLEKDEASLKNILSLLSKKDELVLKLKGVSSDSAAAEAIYSEYQSYSVSDQISTIIKEDIDKMKNDTFNITLSLQIQDITSQQLAAVNHLITSVRDKLESLIVDLEKNKLEELNSPTFNELPSGETFDAKAAYTKSTERQELADSLVKSKATPANTSQDEIDKLFSNVGK